MPRPTSPFNAFGGLRSIHSAWKRSGTSLIMTANPGTDFWRKTFHGYITDNGHLQYTAVNGDLVSAVCFSGDYGSLHDQAGLMLRELACVAFERTNRAGSVFAWQISRAGQRVNVPDSDRTYRDREQTEMGRRQRWRSEKSRMEGIVNTPNDPNQIASSMRVSIIG